MLTSYHGTFSFQLWSHVCDLHESCSRHCFSCPGALCDHLAPSPPACSWQSLAPRPRAPDSQRPRVASRKHCRWKAPVCIRIFLSRSSRRDSFRRCSLSTHLDSLRRGLLLLVDTHHRLISTFPSKLASRRPLLVDSSRLVYRHVPSDLMKPTAPPGLGYSWIKHCNAFNLKTRSEPFTVLLIFRVCCVVVLMRRSGFPLVHP